MLVMHANALADTRQLNVVRQGNLLPQLLRETVARTHDPFFLTRNERGDRFCGSTFGNHYLDGAVWVNLNA